MQVVRLKISCLQGVSVLMPGDGLMVSKEKAADMIAKGQAEPTDDPVLVEMATSRYEFYRLNP